MEASLTAGNVSGPPDFFPQPAEEISSPRHLYLCILPVEATDIMNCAPFEFLTHRICKHSKNGCVKLLRVGVICYTAKG